MFQWKVYSYQNINGQEKSFEKKFDNYDDYQKFMWEQNGFAELSSGSLFDSFLDSFFDRKVLEWAAEDSKSKNLPVNLDKYENESRKIDMDESEKKEKKTALEKAKEKLHEYKEKFTKSDKKDLVKDVEADIKKIDEELKSYA